MLLKIIAEIIIRHNRVIYHSNLPGNIPPEESLKSDQATQGAINTTAAAILPLFFAFTCLPLMALLSTIHASLASLMGCSHRTFWRGRGHLIASRCHLRTTGRQRHRPCKQGQNRNQQYDGVQLSHYIANINKKPAIL